MKKIFTFWMMALLSVVSLGQNEEEYILLEQRDSDISVGGVTLINATIYPYSDSNKDVSFYCESLHPEVAAVEVYGNEIYVFGIDAGVVDIIVHSSNGLETWFQITVYWIEAESISLTPYLELWEGESKYIYPEYTPANASNQTINLFVDDNGTDVITVSNTGRVIGKMAGTATIIAMTPNGLEARCEVVVKSGLSPIIGSGKVRISGTVFFDENENGILDGEEYGLPQQKLLILPDSVYTYTDNSGKYSFSCKAETVYQIIPQLSDNWKLTTETKNEITLGKNDVTGIDFGIKNIKDERKPEVSIITSEAGRCSDDFSMYLSFKNNGTVSEQGCIQLNLLPGMQGIVSSQEYDSISVDKKTLYWNVNVRPFEKLFIILITKMPNFNFRGDTLESVVSYKDAESVLCSDTANVIVRCSFDPNDKTVFPMGVTDENLVLMNEPLSYTIRFQNTGNDYAKNVVVIDTLSSALDLETFEVVAASHNLKTNYTSDGVVEFRFDDIMLLDSTTNEPESHGFVKYRIKAKRDLPDNTVVENTAHIFFDYNPAVVTNTTMNTITYTILKNEESTAIEIPYDATVKLYPNPISDYAVLEFDNVGNDLFQLTISDVSGKVVNTMQTSGNSFVVGKGLGKGVYLYSLKNTQTNQVYRNSFLVE